MLRSTIVITLFLILASLQLERSCAMTVVEFFNGPGSSRQEEQGARSSRETATHSEEVAAWVNDIPIFVRDVDRELGKALNDRHVGGDALKFAKAQALEQLISRQLVLLKLKKDEMAASDADLLLRISQMEEQLERTNQTLEDWLSKQRVTRSEFDREIYWQLSWRNYLADYLTEENLERFFEQRKERFDGTQKRIRQIVWHVDENAPDDKWISTEVSAMRLKKEIENSANLAEAFAQAAAKHSDSPSGKAGGDIGWYSIDGELPKNILNSAFELKPLEISAPIRTSFGIHIIQVTEVRPGEKTWQEVRSQLQRAAQLYLFDWISEQERKLARIRYADDYPHFEPGTKRLAN